MGLFNDSSSDRPCRLCERWGGDVAGGMHALCLDGNRRQVRANPERGCSAWIRCIGADDEPNGTMDKRPRE
jgi:hypothetical protein